MLRPRHGMVDPRRLTSRTFAPLLYAITRQPSSFSSFARARAAEGLGDCHNALRANSIPAGFLACPHVLDHTSLGRLVSAHRSDLLPTPFPGGCGMTCPRCQQDNPVPDAQFCPRCGAPVKHAHDSHQPAASYADVQRSLTEALEQQTATSEILRVISTSPTDAQPVFDTIIQNAVRLLGGFSGVVTRLVDGQLHLGALTSTNPSGDAAQQALWPRPVKEDRSLHGQVISALEPRFIIDVEADRSIPPEEIAVARARAYRSMVAVPLLRDARAVGSMTVTRRAPGLFSESEIELLKTFARQAVIAIENVRLFTELEGRNRDLTATGEILRVISQSPTDTQPVFDAIVESAVRLCDGIFGAVYRFDGELLHSAAHYRFTPEAVELIHRRYPMQPRGFNALALEQGDVVQSADVLTDPRTANPELARALGYRSTVSVPISRGDQRIGVIAVFGTDAKPFSDKQVRLLQTFADQAVIAIENVRLFKELEVRNRDLTQALEQQTATSEILRVISSSPTDEQPVFEAIVDSARRLCESTYSTLQLVEDGQLTIAAIRGIDEAGIAAM